MSRSTLHIQRKVGGLTCFCLLLIAVSGCARYGNELEQSVCGNLLEPFVFWRWSRIAGEANLDMEQRVDNASAIEYQTRDGRILRGYRLAPESETASQRGFILVAQGNAMLAEQLLQSLQVLAQAGFTVFVYDYRGYGRSEGKRRLKAILSDYQEIYLDLRASHPHGGRLYGISFGGIVMLNLIGTGIEFHRAVIDSTPSRLSPFGCPPRFDPVNNLPETGSQLLMIAGARDEVVSPGMSRELREMLEIRGGQVEVNPAYGHPFVDISTDLHRSRMLRIRDFLMQ